MKETNDNSMIYAQSIDLDFEGPRLNENDCAFISRYVVQRQAFGVMYRARLNRAKNGLRS